MNLKKIIKLVIGIVLMANFSFSQSPKKVATKFKNPLPERTYTKGNQSKFAGFSKKDNYFKKNGYTYFFDFSKSKTVTKGITKNNDKENFFQLYSNELSMNENDNFKFISSETDELGITHHLYKQTYKTISVEGSGFVLHEKNGTIEKANGKFFNGLNLNTTPTITEQSAVEKAKKALEGTGVTNDIPSIVIAPLNGNYQTENFRLSYKIKVTTEKPYQIYDVFINAHTGEIINKVSKIAHGDVTGSGKTLYSGTKSFTTDNNGSGFRLRETKRPIQTFNMQNGTDYSKAIDFTDNDNNWVEQTPTLEYIVINSISQNWWYNSISDTKPDLYIIVKDANNNVVYKSDYSSNTNPPNYIPVKLQLKNPPYVFEIWDYDFGSSDDFGGSYSINTSSGTNNFSGNGNDGEYEINVQNNPALDAHWAMEKVYDFYLSQFSRNSYDNKGSVIKNYVHCDFSLNNAFWDGKGMSYGDGDGSFMKSLVGFDVVGHEFTHAVVDFNGGGGLDYEGESGALNESFADIFGTATEFYGNSSSGDWTVGEDVMVTEPFMRSLSNPNISDQPDTYGNADFYWADPTNLTNDDGGVHINSGVQNYWFYLLSVGGNGTNKNNDSYSITGIGIDKAQKIAYRNLTKYLIASTSSNYLDSYYGSIESVIDLYGNGSTEYWAVVDAWYAVGIGSTSDGYCGGITELKESSGTFTDGSGTADYNDNSDCMWLIAPTGANTVTLKFTAFNTELDYDGIVIFDGPDTNSTVLDIFTGTSLPSSVTSSGGAMLVWFISDDATTAGGWSANYTSTGTAYCNGETVISAATGSFTDGSGTNNYANNSECVWYIAPPGATSVTLSFSAFNLEKDNDAVVVFDDYDATNVLGVFSGSNIPSSVTSNTGEMIVVFISDYKTNFSGFSANYTSKGTPYCSGTTTLTSDFDVINDGSGTKNYYNNSNCQWLIQPAGATSITLIFTDFKLEEPSSDGKSIFDFIEVFDGVNASAKLLGKFSGSNIPPSVTSTGGSMFIKFTSDIAENDSGWEAYYLSTTNTYCINNAPLTAATGTITDGSGSSQYGNNSDCSWLIQPPKANSITLTFTAFDTEKDFDGVIIYDGANPSSKVLATYTGSTIPSPVISTGGSMYIWFLSDESYRQNGWSANYTSKTIGIDEKIVAKDFSIVPNPNNGKFDLLLNTFNLNKLEIKIYNAIGQIVWSNMGVGLKAKNEIDLSYMNNGIYIVEAKNENGTEVVKFIINK
jgi:Zn-dependent metalloprotease